MCLYVRSARLVAPLFCYARYAADRQRSVLNGRTEAQSRVTVPARHTIRHEHLDTFAQKTCRALSAATRLARSKQPLSRIPLHHAMPHAAD